jgi:hypothetical protein
MEAEHHANWSANLASIKATIKHHLFTQMVFFFAVILK